MDMRKPNPAGYNHPLYARAFREYGTQFELPRCGGWILERTIPGTSYSDGMGCYPLFSCRDWSRLHEDLNEIQSRLVSLVLVTDPFCTIDRKYLEGNFQIVRPFKRHLIADLTRKPEDFVDKHHSYYARRSLKEMHVEVCDEPLRYADQWIKLYNNLITRYKITGMRSFSKDSFLTQLEMPGVVLVLGKMKEEVVGGHILVIDGNAAFSHLAAYTDAGYKQRASYGIYWITLQYLKKRQVQYLDLGAAAGMEENAADGLTKFKMGWSNDSRIVYLCGRIFNHEQYAEIVRLKNIEATDYFPAYRREEFR